MIYIILEATGFLRYMVRTIAGTLILAGQGKINSGDAQGDSGVKRAGEGRPDLTRPRSLPEKDYILDVPRQTLISAISVADNTIEQHVQVRIAVAKHPGRIAIPVRIAVAKHPVSEAP